MANGYSNPALEALYARMKSRSSFSNSGLEQAAARAHAQGSPLTNGGGAQMGKRGGRFKIGKNGKKVYLKKV